MEFYRMKKFPSRLLALALVFSLGGAALAQQPPAQSPPSVVDEEDVVRITTNLVQFDAVVLDKSGKQVTDLHPEDFEVLKDGKPQPVTNLSYVSLDNRTIKTTTTATVHTKGVN